MRSLNVPSPHPNRDPLETQTAAVLWLLGPYEIAVFERLEYQQLPIIQCVWSYYLGFSHSFVSFLLQCSGSCSACQGEPGGHGGVENIAVRMGSPDPQSTASCVCARRRSYSISNPPTLFKTPFYRLAKRKAWRL